MYLCVQIFFTISCNSLTGDTQKYLKFLRFKVWSFENISYCDGRYIRQICNFGVGDVPRLTYKYQMFANKFLSEFQPYGLTCLEEWLRNKTIAEKNRGFVDLPLNYYRHVAAKRPHN